MENKEEDKKEDITIDIDPDEVVNQNDVILFGAIKCPIDLAIPLNPEICVHCLTVFCGRCVKDCKTKGEKCPICRKEFTTMKIENSLINQQINKLKLRCLNYSDGCKFVGNSKEIKDHLKVCRYVPFNCDVCEKIKINSVTEFQHLIDECPENKVPCFSCNQFFRVKEIANHMSTCDISKNICSDCYLIHDKPKIKKEEINEGEELINAQKIKCDLGSIKCKQCNSLCTIKKIKNKSHICYPKTANEKDKILANCYDKLILLNDIRLEYYDKYKQLEEKFNKYIKFKDQRMDYTAGILADENLKIERKIYYQSKLYKKKFDLKKEELRRKNEDLKKLNKALRFQLKFKEMENKSYNDYIEDIKKDFNENISLSQKKAYDKEELNIEEKILKVIMTSLNNSGEVINKIKECQKLCESKEKEVESHNNGLLFDNFCSSCKECCFDLSKCYCCEKLFCRNCLGSCGNFSRHLVESKKICKECTNTCCICGNTFCLKCIKKCFYSECKNTFCVNCYEKNSHLEKDRNFNCRIFKCSMCHKEGICLMKSMTFRNHRYCKACYFKVYDYYFKEEPVIAKIKKNNKEVSEKRNKSEKKKQGENKKDEE